MVTVPKKSQKARGISPIKLAKNLVIALGLRGVFDFDSDPKKWEKGLEGAVAFGLKEGVEFNFREMHFKHLYGHANKAGILYRLEIHGIMYTTPFKTVKKAREYMEECGLDGKEMKLYEGMAKAFLKRFGNSGKQNGA